MSEEHEDIQQAAPDQFYHPVTLIEQTALGGSKQHPYFGALISDLYAAHAAQGILSGISHHEGNIDPRRVATMAFAIADAMLIVRRDRAMMAMAAEQRAQNGGQ